MKYLVSLNGKDYEVEVDKEEAVLLSVTDTPTPAPAVATLPASMPLPVAAPSPAPVAVTGDPVTAPLPGSVLSVKAAVGAAVKKGDVLVVIEAMKMENDVLAPRDGTVGAVFCKSGDTVQTDALLMTLV